MYLRKVYAYHPSFFQNEVIFYQLDELDRIGCAWIQPRTNTENILA